jgi:hypothetical protein
MPISEYIPQGHRFNIFEDVGCFPFTYNTPVGIVIVSVPPILIGCVSAVYSGTIIFLLPDFLSLRFRQSFSHGCLGVQQEPQAVQ